MNQDSCIIVRKVPEFFKCLYYSSQVCLEGLPQPPCTIVHVAKVLSHLDPSLPQRRTETHPLLDLAGESLIFAGRLAVFTEVVFIVNLLPNGVLNVCGACFRKLNSLTNKYGVENESSLQSINSMCLGPKEIRKPQSEGSLLNQ